MKINDCYYAIDGLRDFVFTLCSSVYERIDITANVCNNQFFHELGTPENWRFVIMRLAAANSRAANSC